MPNGLALATLILITALVCSYVITVFLSLIVSPSHTKRKDLKELVKKLDLKEGDVFADLGCGDGRVVFEVAKNFKDVKCIGYEISPIHIMIAKLSKILLFPFSKRVRIIPTDFCKENLSHINTFYINWGNKETPCMKTVRKNLKKCKGVTILEM
ncbi:MAG: class I SAM-dependent methyltransferase [Candidatus Dojkabacteria bacterium]|jgi:precorrin-6B methylase 2|nr:class I SAM-dependent methyltransferase [Candidatus Dojkabacteria bacterium]MDD2270013.1 class I SAM-dependent methyltransferase [Candidatus Dojkabacteria bacterium]